MFSIKVVGNDDRYTVHECVAYSVGQTEVGLRSIYFWGKGTERNLIIVDGEKTVVAYVTNNTGHTIDVIRPLTSPSP